MNITGRLTRDAEVRTTSQEKQVVHFSVAVNDGYRNSQGDRIEQTAYFDCSYWLTPNVAKYLTKGTLVELSGRVSARAWKGQDGAARAGLNFHTATIKFHGTSSNSDGGGKNTATVQADAVMQHSKLIAQPITEDVPF